jgi:hypothetical protein
VFLPECVSIPTSAHGYSPSLAFADWHSCGSRQVAPAEPAQCRAGLCALKSAHGGKARVGRLAGHIGEISTKTRQCCRDVVAVDTRQVVPHQLLGVIAAVEIDIHTQQELVEPGGCDTDPFQPAKTVA